MLMSVHGLFSRSLPQVTQTIKPQETGMEKRHFFARKNEN